MMAILSGVRWYFIAVLICISPVLMMLSTEHFSCVCWPPGCLLWRTVYWDRLTIVWLGCLLFWCWAVWTVWIFWTLTPCQLLRLQIFSPILRAVFSTYLWFPFLCKSFYVLLGSICLFLFFIIILESGLKKILYQRVFCLCFPLRVL